MLRSSILAASALALALTGTAATAGDDLTYRHGREGSLLIEQAHGKPYWLLFSECAGFYGAMANFNDASGQPERADQLKQTGVGYLNAALSRLQSDRGIARTDAIALAEPKVTGARIWGESQLQQAANLSLPPDALMRSTCEDISTAYAGRSN